MFATQIHRVIPVCSVEQSAFILVKPGDSWPSPVVENASSIDKDITRVCKFSSTLEIFNGHCISTCILNPLCANNLVFGFDKLVKIVFSGKIAEVVENLFATGVYGRPVELWLE
jgi:hypothetical protein